MSHLTPEAIETLAASAATDPHLATCAECRKALGSAKGRRALLKGMKDVTLTEAAFRRVEAKLMDEARAPQSAWGLVFAQFRSSWMIGAALVALALVVVVPKLIEPEPVPARVPVAVKDAPVRPADSAQWTAVVVEGVVHRNGSALVAGDVLKPADVVDARMGRLVLAQLDREVHVELLGLAKLGGAAMVSLEEGTLAVEAAPEVLVEAAGAWVMGSDTAFVVTRAAAEVVVELVRGSARVGSDSYLRDAVTLTAPQRLTLGLPVKPPFSAVDSAAAPYPFTQIPKQPWARLDLSDLSMGAPFDIAGHHGSGPSSLLLTEGRHRLMVGAHESWVQLVPGSDTKWKAAPRGIAQAKEELEDLPPSPEAISNLQRSLKDQRPKLRACYEKWLKANPAASGEVVLTLSLSKAGKVLGARVDDATIPAESVECLVRTGKRLVLPPLGSAQEIEVPLSFTQGGSR